jgi:hypothetical protein
MIMEPRIDERHFLRSVLSQLRSLEQAAQAHYHGVLASMLSAARQETEMLLHEDLQARDWPKSPDDRWAKHH